MRLQKVVAGAGDGSSKKCRLIHPPLRVGTGRGNSRPYGGRWSGRCARTPQIRRRKQAAPPHPAASQSEGLFA